MAAELTFDLRVDYPKGPTIEGRLDNGFAAGPVAVLFGASGSGKTTLLRCMAGLQTPTLGRIAFNGESWFDRDRKISVPPQRRRVGYLFQQYALFPHLTVERNVAYGLRGMADDERRSRVGEALERMGIASLAQRRIAGLSGGEQQRVALARTLAPQPNLLLLDEPLSALDAPTRGALRSELRRILLESRIPAIVVTHDQTEALALGDSLLVMSEGRLLQDGPIREVFEKPANEAVARSVGVDCVAEARVLRVDGELAVYVVGQREVVGLARDAGDSQEGYVFIRAENVTLSSHAPSGESARNHLEGVVLSVVQEGPLARVQMDCSFPLAAVITRHSFEEMGLSAGSRLYANIKAPAVHFVPHQGSA